MYRLVIAFCCLAIIGGIVDSFIWWRRKLPWWIKKRIDIWWLMLYSGTVPFFFLWAGRAATCSLGSLVLWYLATGSGASVLWDLVYSKLTRGRWVDASMMKFWLWIPGVIRVSFNRRETWVWHMLRFFLLVFVALKAGGVL